MNNLKDTIQKNFDKKKNYNIILSKIERRDNMKVKLSYVLASSLVAIALLVGIVAYNVPKSNNENVMPPTVQGILELNINKAEYQSMMTLDADIKEANTELNSEFEKDFSFVIQTGSRITTANISHNYLFKAVVGFGSTTTATIDYRTQLNLPVSVLHGDNVYSGMSRTAGISSSINYGESFAFNITPQYSVYYDGVISHGTSQYPRV